ncbi:hypothetical protein DFJ58DRAFT_447641 [Suillus subalutaceus]|uniref:uncharacterized protein n=1 Tax=Suillus subalutaceus TaxID=48586 RepID=UPI001B870BD8|nr:uncharacterized protein DFJ58DRAFT_447641 [Suillus subalutaceus]KAG1849942.1 hypothetical protein DFJ58DRAFT_447641 [Suillus subalutaceus]
MGLTLGACPTTPCVFIVHVILISPAFLQDFGHAVARRGRSIASGTNLTILISSVTRLREPRACNIQPDVSCSSLNGLPLNICFVPYGIFFTVAD